jgi:hypothetical protein
LEFTLQVFATESYAKRQSKGAFSAVPADTEQTTPTRR